MRTVFADTSYWFALLNPRDQWHQAAIRATVALGDCRIYTTEMVLTELLNSVSRLGEAQRAAVAQRVRELRHAAGVTVIEQTTRQFQQALDYYQSRLDQRWGHTDCASFLAMHENGITHALTADRDFAQAGFTILL